MRLKKLPFRHRKMFKITSLVVHLWEIFVFFTLIIYIMYVLTEISFEHEILDHKQFTSAVFSILTLNIVKQLNTEVMQKGMIIRSRREVLWIYLKHYFLTDFLTLLTIFYNFPFIGSFSKLVVFLILPRNARVL